VAEPARTRRDYPIDPADVPIDPSAVHREYRRQRAMRHARERRTRERRAASIRFWLIVVGLLALSVYFAVAMWHQVQRLFGL
jgi:hypothetical protein